MSSHEQDAFKGRKDLDRGLIVDTLEHWREVDHIQLVALTQDFKSTKRVREKSGERAEREAQ